jgi:hypothetical protein
MFAENAETEDHLRRALEKLSGEFLGHPDVSLIDFGHQLVDGRPTDNVVLRIHLNRHWMNVPPAERPTFPAQVDEIPVVVMFGDYTIETPAAKKE